MPLTDEYPVAKMFDVQFLLHHAIKKTEQISINSAGRMKYGHDWFTILHFLSVFHQF